jgi:putative heme iron utilization protein
MADIITPEISDRICKHMNDDHADAITLYAKVYGGIPHATTAEMVKIDPHGMDLLVQNNGEPTSIRIPFDHELQDSEDAHQTLITMVRNARSQP